MLLGSTGKIHHSIVSRNKNAKYGKKKNVSSSINCWCLYEQNDTDALLKNFLACVASVSNRVIARKLEREQKKKKRWKGEGEGRRGNACLHTP